MLTMVQISAEANRRTQRWNTFIAHRDNLVRLYNEELSNHRVIIKEKYRPLNSAYLARSARSTRFDLFSWSGWVNRFRHHKISSSKAASEELRLQSRLYAQYQEAFRELSAQSGFEVSSKELEELR